MCFIDSPNAECSAQRLGEKLSDFDLVFRLGFHTMSPLRFFENRKSGLLRAFSGHIPNLFLGLILGLIYPVTSRADVVEYSNGSINGSINGWTISTGTSVSNSFSISGSTTLISASFGTWAQSGVTPNQVDWSIGTTAFGSEINSGTSSTTNSVFLTHPAGKVYESTISLSATLTAGTYYFTLQNASSNPAGQTIFWDQNNGSSTAFSKTGSSTTTIGSESFTLYSASAAVPEPSTIVMAALLGGLGYLHWNQRHRGGALQN